MKLHDITVNRVGVLHDIRLADIPMLSVIYGGNGSGKSTLVRFVLDTLLEADAGGSGSAPESPQGTITISDRSHRWDVTRYQSPDGRTRSRVSWQDNSGWSDSLRSRFPSWVTEDVFREIFCPGYAEADRFDLLSRLCLESAGTIVDDAEVQKTERAIRLCREERDGTHSVLGINQQIADLERQRDELRRELTNLKRHDPSIPREIASLEARIAALRARDQEIDREIGQLRARIAELEQRIARLLQRNVLPLNVEQIRRDLAELIERRDRWATIRSSIENESSRNGQSASLSPMRSHRSIRAIVDRLEERLGERLQQSDSYDRQQWNERITTEVAALCNFVNQQQEAATGHEHQLEEELTTLSAEFARRIEATLQTRIDALQEELGRSENILDGVHHRDLRGCSSSWHRDVNLSGEVSGETLEALRMELRRRQEQREARQSERSCNSDEIRTLTIRLEERRRQLTGFVSLEHIDELQARIAELDSRIDLFRRHDDVLSRTEVTLREVLARLRERRHPGALEIAAPWIRTLTEGECTGFVTDSSGRRLLVTTGNSAAPLRIDQLSRGTQHQVALVLRLALLQVRASDSDHMPLIIDDVFITSDDTRGALAADLLRAVAANGQQILLLTCQNDVRRLMADRGAHVYWISDAPVARPLPLVSIPAPLPAPVIPTPAVQATPIMMEPPRPQHVATFVDDEPHDVSDDDDSHWLFYLEPDHPVSDLSGLELSELNALQGIGIEYVDDLMSTTATELENALSDAGYHMTEERIRELQAQAEMVICVPMLRQRDAELLIAAGIDNVRQLARLRPEAIHDLVVRFQKSDSGHRYLRSGHAVDQQQAISWNRWALHARSVDRARNRSSRQRIRRGTRRPRSSSQSDLTIGSRRERIRRRSDGGVRHTVRTRVPESGRRRENRVLQRRQQRRGNGHGNGNSNVATLRSEEQTASTERRFYLSRSSNVEAAPSIGPRTAARLAKVGIVNVDDLLTCDPDTIATLLDNRRISADVIRQWQDQARLVCTIPQLRGHDAQILVACGQTDAAEIGDQSPERLFAMVKPFCDTSEGERIVRGGRKPDLKEVKDWISWARRSRPLKVA